MKIKRNWLPWAKWAVIAGRFTCIYVLQLYIAECWWWFFFFHKHAHTETHTRSVLHQLSWGDSYSRQQDCQKSIRETDTWGRWGRHAWETPSLYINTQYGLLTLKICASSFWRCTALRCISDRNYELEIHNKKHSTEVLDTELCVLHRLPRKCIEETEATCHAFTPFLHRSCSLENKKSKLWQFNWNSKTIMKQNN